MVNLRQRGSDARPTQEATMYLGGIDAHEHYLVVAVVDTQARTILTPIRVSTVEPDELHT